MIHKSGSSEGFFELPNLFNRTQPALVAYISDTFNFGLF